MKQDPKVRYRVIAGASHGLHVSLFSLALVVGGTLAAVHDANAQETAAYFRQNCMSCHTIGGGRLTGPDLKNVSDRKDRQWLIRFIMDPKGVIDSGDAYAAKIVKESNGAVMTAAVGMTKEKAEALLDLIEAESKLERSEFAGVQVSSAPFTEKDVRNGEDYFTGMTRFENGGAPCFSCHTVRGVGALSGGRVGPDLTSVYANQGGRKPLSAWLHAPATTTMQPLYKERPLTPEEIHAVVAFFEHSAKQGGEEDMSGPMAFLLLGLGGAAIGFVLFDSLWRNRFRAVRRLLVHGPHRQGETQT